MMYVVAHSYSADTRKMIADKVVIDRTKLYTSAAMTAGLSSGSSTRFNVVAPRAPSVVDASSRLRSICAIEAMPARTPTGMLRNTLQTISTSAVPVISIGGTLKARMYETPITVPGIANDSIVPNSNAARPAKRCRVRMYAVRIPRTAVIGAATAESSTVVQNELHDVPDQKITTLTHSIENGRVECFNVGV